MKSQLIASFFSMLALIPCGIIAQQSSITVKGPGECEVCHEGQSVERLSMPTSWMEYDIHFKNGMGCVDCHGGDPESTDQQKAHSTEAGYKGIPTAGEIPEMCSHCHSSPSFMIEYNPSLPVDQHDKYLTSRHGELLQMGLRKVAQCSSCHTSHNVRPATDPNSSVYPINLPETCNHCHGDKEYMAGFPIPTDQFAKYKTSVHGIALLENEDLGSPACNDCHGNHGAVPPGAQSLGHVCGGCHALNADMARQSPHAEIFELQELSQCIVCHDHHAIAHPSSDTFKMGADSICISCHRPNDDGWETGQDMYTLVVELQDKKELADEMIDEAHQLGMDVSEAEFLLLDYRKARLQLRTVSHSLNYEEFEEVANEANLKASLALEIAEELIEEYYYRRAGLLISLLLCLPVLILLYYKIRSLE